MSDLCPLVVILGRSPLERVTCARPLGHRGACAVQPTAEEHAASLLGVIGNVTHDDGETILCPHCGKPNGDLWEQASDDATAECSSCNKSFRLVRTTTVSYAATALP